MKILTIQPLACSRILLKLVTVLLLCAAVLSLPKHGIGQEIGASLEGKAFQMAINRPETTPLTAWCIAIYTEVFKRLGIPFKAHYYPLRRATEEVMQGRLDGEPARIAVYGDIYPNLIRVEETVFTMTVAAYTANPSAPSLEGWESLRGTKYQIDYPRGMQICEINLSFVVRAEQLDTVTKSIQGLQMLAAKRIDLYIDDVNSVAPILNDPAVGGPGAIYEAGIMEVAPLYMYIVLNLIVNYYLL
ncbi:hypothetical protein JWG39_13515 [Desulforhopalus vacuolatus]|uniref:hypothetical protein n=1 Tax=Desulforhopalus vacuolatus TaxID=40414 RepID=UPI001962F467|nr:hypothetical protein [Desulforhopalus vacuolatus]MBM9520836.1 hypothetical protein [Desulforhopalus vacuolatus]